MTTDLQSRIQLMYSDGKYDPTAAQRFKQATDNNQPNLALQLMVPIINSLLEEVSALRQEVNGLKDSDSGTTTAKATATRGRKSSTANKNENEAE